MKCWAIILFWAVAAWSWGAEISVMSWNVQNYLSCDRMVAGKWTGNYPKPEAEKTALFEVVRETHPDVLGVMELGGGAYFDEFKARLKKAGMDYPYAEDFVGSDTSRTVAVFSKIPFEAVHHGVIPFRYQGGSAKVLRGLTEVRFGGAQGWRLYLVHLKSKLGDLAEDPDATEFRVGEAQAIRDVIINGWEEREAPAYLLVGDFNDSPRSRAVARFLKKGKTTLATILPAFDSNGETWTERWEKEGLYSRIDLAMVSPTFAPRVVKTEVVDLPAVMEASDHRPLKITLELPEAAPKLAPLKSMGAVAPKSTLMDAQKGGVR
jgi:endonuclease/exonuclease/phosphatase family metal-dependent hydrolase